MHLNLLSLSKSIIVSTIQIFKTGAIFSRKLENQVTYNVIPSFNLQTLQGYK